MPLSEHEQRQLEQIEQALYADYPKLAQAVRAQDPRVHYKRRLVLAAATFLLGAGLLAAGIIIKDPYAEGGGGAVMLVGVAWAVISWRFMSGIARQGFGPRRGGRRPATGRSSRRRRAKSSTPFMERLEERWHRRQGGAR